MATSSYYVPESSRLPIFTSVQRQLSWPVCDNYDDRLIVVS